MRSIDDNIRRLFTALYNSNDGERHNAADLLYKGMLTNGVHPDDVHLSVHDDLINGQQDVIRYLKDQLQRAERESEYLRRSLHEANPKALKRALEAQDIDYRWPEFEDMIRDRITGDHPDDDLEHGWKAKVCAACDIGASTLNRWRLGVDAIPTAAFDALRTLDPVPIKVKRRKNGKAIVEVEDFTPAKEKPVQRQRRSSGAGTGTGKRQQGPVFPWSEESFGICARGFLNAWTPVTIAEHVTNASGLPCNDNQILQATWNSPPRYPFPVQPSDSELPLEWTEAWQIGGTLFRRVNGTRGWMRTLFLELGVVEKRHPGPPHPIDAAPFRVRLLRQKYHDAQDEKERERLAYLESRVSRLRQGASTVLYDNIVAAGPTGATLREVAARLGWDDEEYHSATSRPSELARRLDIFLVDVSKERGGQIWVAAEHKDQWPKEWAVAQQNHRAGSTSR